MSLLPALLYILWGFVILSGAVLAAIHLLVGIADASDWWARRWEISERELWDRTGAGILVLAMIASILWR